MITQVTPQGKNLAVKVNSRNHQLVAYDLLEESVEKKGGYCLFSQAGTGKSKIIIDFLRMHLHTNKEEIAIIVAPKRIIPNWKREFEKFATSLDSVAILDRGTGDDKFMEFIGGILDGKKVFLMNYEPFTKWFGKPKELSRFLGVVASRNKKVGVVVVDESSRLADTGTKFFAACSNFKSTEIYSAPRFILLNGTPIEQCLSHVWPQFSIAYRRDPFEINSFYGFINCFFNSYGSKLTIRNDMKVAYEDILKKNSFRITLDEIGDMPEYNFVDVPTEWSEAKKYYDQLRSLFAMEYDVSGKQGVYKTSVFIAAVEKLLQCCTGIINTSTMKENPNYIYTKEAEERAGLVCDLLDQVKSKAIIFTRHVENTAYIYNVLKKNGHKVSMLKGGMSVEEGYDAWNGLETGKYDVGVFQINSGGIGINCPSVKHVIFYEHWWSARLRSQALGRAKRLTSNKQSIVIHDIFVPGTVEEYVLIRQTAKLDEADDMLFKIVEEVFGSDRAIDMKLNKLLNMYTEDSE